MPSGLIALLDDVSMIAKLAVGQRRRYRRRDRQGRDQGGGRGDRRHGGDPALRHRPDPDRELPIIWKIALG